MLSSLRPSTWPAGEIERASGRISAILSSRLGRGFFPLASLLGWQASGEHWHPLGYGFELPHGLAAKDQRDKSADRHDDEDRTEEYRRRAGVRFHQKRRQHPGEQPRGRLAEGLAAPTQRRWELLGK